MENYSSKQLKLLLTRKLSHNFGVAPENASDEIFYKASALVLSDIMRDRRMKFRDAEKKADSKRIYYLSMEFLMGRSFKNTLYNLGLTKEFEALLKEYGVSLQKLYEFENDAGLGNGGLGRLAACFLDALSSGGYSAMGYCIKYELGIFRQKLIDGWQTEIPDFWLPGGEVWLRPHNSLSFEVHFDGYINEWWENGRHQTEHKDYNTVRAVPYDLLVAGNDGKTVNILRLWSAECQDFDMAAFNEGDYVRALEQRAMAESISKVLYPNDQHLEGKSLRLRQQYFLVSASVQDILNHHMQENDSLDNLPEKVAIHINDTHPTLAIPEFMRILLDECGYSWEKAWDIVTRTFAYTNHTIMSEALECWQTELFKARLPRIYQIVCEIDRRYREEVMAKTGNASICEETAIIKNGVIRMANLCVAACHTVNGVSKLHSNIIKDALFNDYYKMTPEKFTNVTNGVAHRRWLCQANPELSGFISELIGDGFINNAAELKNLEKFAEDTAVTKRLAEIKRKNKIRLSNYIKETSGILFSPDSIVDMQVKRLHEYKRQHMNALHIISDYLKIKDDPNADFTPKTYIFGAKAASGYALAKEIIQMIYKLSEMINSDPQVKDKLKVIFLEDYKVTLAELMIPAAEISEQISLASTEASGTSNMKFMLNGAVTIGTEDGANVEIHEAVGDDNIIIFGMHSAEVLRLQNYGYSPAEYYNNNYDLRRSLDFMRNGIKGHSFENIYNTLKGRDYYMALADFADYCAAQNKATELYKTPDIWNRMSLINIANAGIFSADRSVKDYAEKIWHIDPVE